MAAVFKGSIIPLIVPARPPAGKTGGEKGRGGEEAPSAGGGSASAPSAAPPFASSAPSAATMAAPVGVARRDPCEGLALGSSVFVLLRPTCGGDAEPG